MKVRVIRYASLFSFKDIYWTLKNDYLHPSPALNCGKDSVEMQDPEICCPNCSRHDWTYPINPQVTGSSGPDRQTFVWH